MVKFTLGFVMGLIVAVGGSLAAYDRDPDRHRFDGSGEDYWYMQNLWEQEKARQERNSAPQPWERKPC